MCHVCDLNQIDHLITNEVDAKSHVMHDIEASGADQL